MYTYSIQKYSMIATRDRACLRAVCSLLLIQTLRGAVSEANLRETNEKCSSASGRLGDNTCCYHGSQSNATATLYVSIGAIDANLTHFWKSTGFW